MHTARWSRFVCALLVAIGTAGSVEARFGAIDDASQSRPAPSQLAELVSRQLLSNGAQCPRESEVSYEACLLYQGAFGWWRSLGFPEQCGDIPPIIVNEMPLASQVAGLARSAASNPCFATVYALAVANTVPILSSTLNHVFHKRTGAEPENPGSDAERCLTVRYGLCGNHTAIALALFAEAGLTARAVQFFYEIDGVRLSHIAPEVLIDGTYRFVDTTFGAYWRSNLVPGSFALAGIDEIRAMRNPGRRATWNTALAPYTMSQALNDIDPFNYLTARNVTVIRGYQGTIRLQWRTEAGIEVFYGLPNFIGDNQVDGRTAGLEFAIDGRRGSYEMKLRTRASAIGGLEPASICVDDICQAVPTGGQDMVFVVKDPRRLHLRTANDVAYVVIESLSWKRVPPR